MRKQIEKILCQRLNLKSKYFDAPKDNCLPIIHTNWFKIKADISQGSGNELLTGKFNSIGSSSALGVNAFGVFYETNFMHWPTLLTEKYNNPAFEKKLSNGLRGTNPNLDVFFETKTTVLAIECKFLETLGEKKPKFSDQYFSVKDHRTDSKWFQIMIDIVNGDTSFRYLDAAQLIKHYFGLAHEYTGSDMNLHIGYVFWEPNQDGNVSDSVIDLFANHRNECEKFADQVNGDEIQFSFYSYFELIDHWQKNSIKDELKTHFKLLEKKYKL